MPDMPETPLDDSFPPPSRLIAFRPLFWWIAVSALLLAYDFHRINAPKTIITASVTVDGRPLKSGERFFVSVDGEDSSLSKPVAIGKRRVKIGMKDTTVFEEDVDVWYGENNIGSVSLNRQRGILDLEIRPRAGKVDFRGPYREFSVENVSVLRTNIPVGTYEVALSYGKVKKKGIVMVRANQTVTEVLAPDVGLAVVKSDREGSQFALSSTNRSFRAQGGYLPASFALVPGTYSLETWRGDYRKVEQLDIVRGETTRRSITFEYGHLDITTVPVGVSVRSKRIQIGVTPAKLELKPGKYDLRLAKSGFGSVNLPVQIQGNQILSISTNLVNLSLQQALKLAQAFAGRGDYERAIESIKSALSIEPENAQALKLQLDYGRELGLIQGQQALVARRKAVEATFETLTNPLEHAEIFDTHSWVFPVGLQSARDAVRRTIPKCRAKYNVESEANLDQSSVLFKGRSKGLTGYGRHCVVLVTENGPMETQVVAKLWDYIAGTKSGVSIGALLSLNRGIPVHPRHFPQNEKQFILNRRQAVIDEFRGLLESEIKGKGGL